MKIVKISRMTFSSDNAFEIISHKNEINLTWNFVKDCSVNAKHDSSNICECDKRFAKAISETEKSCDSEAASDEIFGDYCLNEDWRTITGLRYGTNQNGSFDPKLRMIY